MEIDEDIKAKVLEVIKELHKELQLNYGEKINLAAVGPRLKDKGIEYKKLKDFLGNFNTILNIESDGNISHPVSYMRLKNDDNFAEPLSSNISESDLKPQYTDSKTPIQALGSIWDYDNAISMLEKKIGTNVDINQLENNIKASYDNNDIIYYEYDVNGNPIKTNGIHKGKTVSFAVNTRFKDKFDKTIYARYKVNNKKEFTSGVFFNTEEEIFNLLNAYKIGTLSFKDYKQANDFINNVKKEAQDEVWQYGSVDSFVRKKTDQQILESYLGTISTVLCKNYANPNSPNYEKIVFSSVTDSIDGKQHKYAIFNTGLLTKSVSCLLIIGEVWESNKNHITISNPQIMRDNIQGLSRKGIIFMSNDLQKVTDNGIVSFFSKVNEIVYDASVYVDTQSLDKLKHCMERGEERNKWKQIWDAKYSNNEERFYEDFRNAINKSTLIAKSNYKYVVPQYQPKTQNIQFLMPLYIDNKDSTTQPDFVLVLSKYEEDGRVTQYIPETLISPEWAYNNARVICKPESTWLDPKKIQDCIDTEDAYED